MSMCSPESFLEDYKNKSYEELLEIRDNYLIDVKYFETHTKEIMGNDEICPSQDIVYWWNLKFLSGLFNLIYEKFITNNEEEQ